mmetsp:Transcript_35739/g.83095  ORF Transcript_35739/g.83095 Transcript_35739/m.83095 type:complete len:603 (+) Transcript_35739:113-1921(+)
MQPLAYFAVRSLLGWLQYIEKADRAFASNALLLVATGAAHCWAVVYALFIAIHTRAMRYDGYHEGYTEHLPIWVSWTETLAVGSMGIWWAAGFTTAAIRVLDDDSGALPSEARDLKPNPLVQLMRSQRLHDILVVAHVVSCVGLFTSIIPLCLAMALMKGTVTACELCLGFVSVGFALPHAAVACRRLSWSRSKTGEETAMSPAPAAEAAAQEAAALGPQLCVILALADSPGHAYLWQNFVYLVSAVAFVAAVAACGRSPPKVGDAALPPESGEVLTCLLLDAAAAVSLVICFPHLNTWHLWAMAALLTVFFVALWFESWRDLFIDFLDPLFVVRSDTDKLLPGQQRQRLRQAAWVATLLCAAVALWDIILHPVEEGLFEPPADLGGVETGLPDIFDQNAMLLLRWRPPPAEAPGEQQMLSVAAEALGIDKDALATQALFPKHRLFLFKFMGGAEKGSALPMHIRWKTAMLSPKGRLGQLAESDFPGALNVTTCLHAQAWSKYVKEKAQKEKAESSAENAQVSTTEGAATTTLQPVHPSILRVVGPSPDAQAAYMAGCDWWSGLLDSFYGSENETHHSPSTQETGGTEEDDDSGEEEADLVD